MSSPSNSELSSSIEALSSKLSNPLPPLDDKESTFPSQLASIIDHTLLAPTATKDDIKRVCKEAIELQAATVCVNSSMIPTAVQALKDTQVLPISVVGFPFGAMESDSKAQEAKTAVQQGAKEIDMVINLGFLLSSDFSSLYQDVSKVVQASSPQPVKVILESSLLNRSQLISASYISCLAGAKFLKTSTGYALPPPDGGWGKSESNDRKLTSGAQKEDVRLMYEVARSRDWGHGYQVEIKASGGIRSLNVVREMWRNGATRVGASGTKKILDELEAERNGKKVESGESKGDGY